MEYKMRRLNYMYVIGNILVLILLIVWVYHWNKEPFQDILNSATIIEAEWVPVGQSRKALTEVYDKYTPNRLELTDYSDILI